MGQERCSSGPTIAAIAAVAVMLAGSTRAAQAQCVRDSECKGTRICEDGKCVAPSEQAAAPKTSSATAASASPSRAAPKSPAAVASRPVEHPQGELEHTNTCECAGTTPSGRAGGMHLGEAQIAALKAAGASLDAKEMAMADALAERGFSSDELVAAFRDHTLLLGIYPELAPYGSATVETIAVAHKLGLDSSDGLAFVWYRHSRNRTLTEAYNEKMLGGPGLMRVGAVAAGTGLALILVGLELRKIASDHPTNYESNDKPDHHFDYPGIAAEITGGFVAIAGIASVTVGLYRWSSWLPPGALDSTPASEMPSMRASASRPNRAAAHWMVLPSLGPQQAGLRFAAAF
jgi:hypothetical protein